MRTSLLCALLALVLAPYAAAGPAELASALERTSVTISAGSSQGSGSIITRDVDVGGKKVSMNFVWTAGHVIRGLRKVREVIGEKGETRKVVAFDDPSIIIEKRENGEKVSEHRLDCRVVKYTDPDNGDDLALLMVKEREWSKANTVFAIAPTMVAEIVPIGTPLSHCGSLLGQFGANSYTTGTMSQIGRIYQGVVYDQTTTTAFPGSSGGGVYKAEGDKPLYVGMLVRGSGETFCLIVPIRRIHAWAKKAKIEWALDPKIPVPSFEDIRKIRIEDEGAAGGRVDIFGLSGSHHDVKIPFLIEHVDREPLFLRPGVVCP